MTTILTITATLREKCAPLYLRYPDQLRPQPARLRITQYGIVVAWVDPDVGGGKTWDEHHGRTQVIPLRSEVVGRALADWLDDKKTIGLLQAVVDGLTITWNGRDDVGVMSDNAMAALGALREQAGKLPNADVWEVSDWLDGRDCESAVYGPIHRDDFAEATDDELKEIAAGIEDDAESEDVAIDGDVFEFLVGMRQREIEHLQGGMASST